MRKVALSREAEENAGAFGRKIRELQPDIVIDMICFTEASARHLVEALRGQVQHFLHTGTIWVHGPSVEVPTTEMQPRRPFGAYGIAKARIEAYLIEMARKEFVSRDDHPSRSHRRAGLGAPKPRRALRPERLHSAGQRRRAFAAQFRPRDRSSRPRGRRCSNVHVRDRSLERVGGGGFPAVSLAAITLRGYAEAMAAWFGRKPNLRFLPWPEWKGGQSELEVEQTYDHIAHSPNCSIAKAERMLGYRPRYSSIDAVCESVSWLIEKGIVQVEPKAV